LLIIKPATHIETIGHIQIVLMQLFRSSKHNQLAKLFFLNCLHSTKEEKLYGKAQKKYSEFNKNYSAGNKKHFSFLTLLLSDLKEFLKINLHFLLKNKFILFSSTEPFFPFLGEVWEGGGASILPRAYSL
jgi:hypothetical protein